jgi:hypothetical protein
MRRWTTEVAMASCDGAGMFSSLCMQSINVALILLMASSCDRQIVLR